MRRRDTSSARRTLALLGLLWSASASAQVLEIGDDGRVAVYDRPAVFTDAGVAPIQIERARPSRAAPETVRREIAEAAQTYAVDAKLLEAVAWRESRFRADALSPRGARGVMQLMPATARDLGVADPLDLRQNVRGGAAYLSQMLGRFGGDVAKSLAAYNAGPAAVERFGGVPPFAETRAYVSSIMGRLSPMPATQLNPLPAVAFWEGMIR